MQTRLIHFIFIGLGCFIYINVTAQQNIYISEINHGKDTSGYNNKYSKKLLVKIDSLIEVLKTEKNYSELLTAYTYKFRSIAKDSDNLYRKYINELEAQITVTPKPYKQIFALALADIYIKSFLTCSDLECDLQDTTVYNEQIRAIQTAPTRLDGLLALSISDTTLLKHSKVEEYKDIISFNEQSNRLYPTLYDVAMSYGIKYYKKLIPIFAASVSRLSDSILFCKASSFCNLKLDKYTQNNLVYKVLYSYQQWMGYRITNASDSIAFADIDLCRLDFIKDYYYRDHDLLYLKALNQIKKEYSSQYIQEEADFRIINYYYSNDNILSDEDIVINIEGIEDLDKILDLCSAFLKNAKNELYKAIVSELKNKIEEKNVNLCLEKTYTSSQPCRALVFYKNIAQVKLNIYSISNQNFIFDKRDDLKTTPFLTKVFNMSSYANDHLVHQEEICFGKLPIGSYVLTIENAQDSNTHYIQHFSNFVVSNIDYSYIINSKSVVLKLFNRRTKQPLSNAKIETKVKSYCSNRRGIIEIPYNVKSSLIINRIIYNQDTLPSIAIDIPNNIENTTLFQLQNETIVQGQPVYYYGQVYNQKGKSLNRFRDTYRTFYLFQELIDFPYKRIIKRQRIKIDKKGKFSSNIIITQDILPGLYFIEDSINSSKIQFEVIERNQPRTEISMNAITRQYNIGDNIEIEGYVKSSSKETKKGQKVNFHVYSTPVDSNANTIPEHQFGNKFFFKKLEINGFTITDQDGKYKIRFSSTNGYLWNTNFKYGMKLHITVSINDGMKNRANAKSIVLCLGCSGFKLNVDSVQLYNEEIESSKIIISSKCINNSPQHISGKLCIAKLKLTNKQAGYGDYLQQDKIKCEEWIKLYPNYSDIHNYSGSAIDYYCIKHEFNVIEPYIYRISKPLSAGVYVASVEIIDSTMKKYILSKTFTIISKEDKIWTKNHDNNLSFCRCRNCSVNHNEYFIDAKTKYPELVSNIVHKSKASPYSLGRGRLVQKPRRIGGPFYERNNLLYPDKTIIMSSE